MIASNLHHCRKCGHHVTPDRWDAHYYWCVDCRNVYQRAYRAKRRAERRAAMGDPSRYQVRDRPAFKIVRPPTENTPECPRMYAQHCDRLQAVVDRIDGAMGWRPRVVVPTSPGSPPQVVERRAEGRAA